MDRNARADYFETIAESPQRDSIVASSRSQTRSKWLIRCIDSVASVCTDDTLVVMMKRCAPLSSHRIHFATSVRNYLGTFMDDARDAETYAVESAIPRQETAEQTLRRREEATCIPPENQKRWAVLLMRKLRRQAQDVDV